MFSQDIFSKSAICRLLEIRYPVLQAGMGQVAYGTLTAAVSDAGGLGVIGANYLSGDELRHEIEIVRKRTDKPFGVDTCSAGSSRRTKVRNATPGKPRNSSR